MHRFFLVRHMVCRKLSWMQTHVVAKSSSREEPRHCNFRNTLGRSHGSNANQQLDDEKISRSKTAVIYNGHLE